MEAGDPALHRRASGIWGWGEQRSGRGRTRRRDGLASRDVPTLETLAAVALLREHLPKLKIRRHQRRQPDEAAAASEHPHGLPDQDFDALFTTDKPIIFAFHGYPWLIHRLTTAAPTRTCIADVTGLIPR
jgi:xylulose-5-phosphate/fructose-6-phosphate phosphoketolase